MSDDPIISEMLQEKALLEAERRDYAFRSWVFLIVVVGGFVLAFTNAPVNLRALGIALPWAPALYFYSKWEHRRLALKQLESRYFGYMGAKLRSGVETATKSNA